MSSKPTNQIKQALTGFSPSGFRHSEDPERSATAETHRNLANLSVPSHSLSDVLVMGLRDNWLNNRPYDVDEYGYAIATTSNLTLHSAMALRETARLFGLRTVFETRGRFDGIVFVDSIELERPVATLLCEWESNAKSALTETGEVQKLGKATAMHPAADCLLLTYVEQAEIAEYTKSVESIWRAAAPEAKKNLFLIAVLYERAKHHGKRAKRHRALRTFKFTPTGVELWDDLPYVPIGSE